MVSAAYLDVMRLDLVAGREFAAGAREALISASLAEVLFGSPFAALGQPLQTAEPRMETRGNAAGTVEFVRETLMQLYTVRGVFAAPTSCGAAPTASPTCWFRSHYSQERPAPWSICNSNSRCA